MPHEEKKIEKSLKKYVPIIILLLIQMTLFRFVNRNHQKKKLEFSVITKKMPTRNVYQVKISDVQKFDFAQIDFPPQKTYNVIIHCFNVLYTNFQGCRTIFNFCVQVNLVAPFCAPRCTESFFSNFFFRIIKYIISGCYIQIFNGLGLFSIFTQN